MAGRVKVRFVRTVTYEKDGPHQGPVYSAGSEHEFDAAFADRWIRRGAAVRVETPAAKPAPTSEPAKPAQAEASAKDDSPAEDSKRQSKVAPKSAKRVG